MAEKPKMYSYLVEIFINEQPSGQITVQAWRSWTAIHRAAKQVEDKISETNRVNQKVVFRCTRIS